MKPPLFNDLGQGITCIDTGYQRPGFAACYLVSHQGEGAFIDTGTTHALPRLLSAIESAGLRLEQVKYVMPTHVHLDHGGGAGALMARLPNAQLVIHPAGARHMIDPTKLKAGATAVYGEEEFSRAFGDVVPVPADRVLEAADGFSVAIGDRPLVCVDTPGHARHHYCVYDEASRGIFTGDTFGISYREFDTDAGPFLFPTSTPVQFDPGAWLQTLTRLQDLAPKRIFLTHFGAIDFTADLAEHLRTGIMEFADIARSTTETPTHEAIRERLKEWYEIRLNDHGCGLSQQRVDELLSMDLDLNAQGLAVWLERERKGPRN